MGWLQMWRLEKPLQKSQARRMKKKTGMEVKAGKMDWWKLLMLKEL